MIMKLTRTVLHLDYKKMHRLVLTGLQLLDCLGFGLISCVVEDEDGGSTKSAGVAPILPSGLILLTFSSTSPSVLDWERSGFVQSNMNGQVLITLHTL